MSGRCTPHSTSTDENTLSGSSGNRVHIGERALAPNSRPEAARRSPPPACLPPARLDRLASSLTCASRVAREWPSRREIVRRSAAPSSHSASLRPLRAGGLDRASAPPEIGNYVMATGRPSHSAGSRDAPWKEPGVMIRSREKRNRRPRRGTATAAARSLRRAAASVRSHTRSASCSRGVRARAGDATTGSS